MKYNSLLAKKVSDDTISIQLPNGREFVSSANFEAHNPFEDTVCIKSLSDKNITFEVLLSGLQVDSGNGESTFSDVYDAIVQLNSFIGNFNSRGSASETTLPGFAAGKKYHQDQAIAQNDIIYVAKADFEAGDEFDAEDWKKVSTRVAAGVGIRIEEIGDGADWLNVDVNDPELIALIKKSIFVEKLGINSLIYPKYFCYDKDLTVSKVILSGNAAGASFSVDGTDYDEEELLGVTVPAGVDLIISDIDIKAGYDTGSITIIF